MTICYPSGDGCPASVYGSMAPRRSLVILTSSDPTHREHASARSMRKHGTADCMSAEERPPPQKNRTCGTVGANGAHASHLSHRSHRS